jgi:hypothetical protein
MSILRSFRNAVMDVSISFSYETLHNLELNTGDTVWVSFKSNSAMAF